MSGSTLYDDDILLWSEQQAAALRKLGANQRSIPNELDIENVAGEIESVGRSGLATVESYLQLIFVHLITLLAEPAADAIRHWRSEIFRFHLETRRRHVPSMRQRIEIEEIWQAALDQTMQGYEGERRDVISGLPKRRPLGLEDLLAQRIDAAALVERLRG